MNRVFLLGNIGAEPEMKHTASGDPYLRFRLATNERYRDRQKEWQEHTEWHSVVIWGKRGEALGRILNIGTRVMVHGALRTSSYEKDGVKRSKTEVRANDVILGGTRSSSPVGVKTAPTVSAPDSRPAAPAQTTIDSPGI